MAQEPRYDFPVVSDQGPRRPKRGERWRETIHQLDEGMDWKKGEHGPKVGTVTVNHPEDDSPKTFDVTFEFDDGDTVEYEGKVPGDGAWKGKSKLRRRRGTKKDEIEVDSVNPKRWG